MADFSEAINLLLSPEVEGEDFSDDKLDLGGATKYGISLRFLQAHQIDLTGDGVIDDADIRALDRSKAERIYERHFWRFGGIESQKVADQCFQIWVNMAPKSAALIFQKALGGKVKIDGILGSKTLAALNEADPEALLKELRVQQILHYHRRVIETPSQGRFIKGWIRRALS